jgi:hypothetical protein
MSDDMATERLRRYGRIGHARERLGRLTASAREVEEWRKRRRRGGQRGGQGKQTTYTEADQAMVAKLTRGQTSTIKLHKELKETEGVVRSLPRLPPGGGATGGGSFPALLSGRGETREDGYMPPPPSVGKRDVAMEPISPALGERLLTLLKRFLSSVEAAGDKMGTAASDGDQGQSLWGAYRCGAGRRVAIARSLPFLSNAHSTTRVAGFCASVL